MGTLSDAGKNEVKADYHRLTDTIKVKVPAAQNANKVREVAVICGQATFVYDFGRGNGAAVGAKTILGDLIHEEAIKKTRDFYKFGLSGPDKRYLRWLETGRHERWCYYHAKYPNANIHEASMTCEAVKKIMDQWGLSGNKIK